MVPLSYKLTYGHKYKLTVIDPDKNNLVQITDTKKNGPQYEYQRAAIPIT